MCDHAASAGGGLPETILGRIKLVTSSGNIAKQRARGILRDRGRVAIGRRAMSRGLGYTLLLTLSM